MPKVWLLDYGAGNVRSLRNALAALGFEVVDITSPAQIADAGVLVFPGVGSFGACMATLAKKGYTDALRAYVRADRPFLGICLGLQTLFEGSEESPGVAGLGIIPATVRRFRVGEALAVPQIGWNGVAPCKPSALLAGVKPSDAVYFVHSFRVADAAELDDWALCLTDYGERYVSAVQRGRVAAVQFHPEKSGAVGLQILRNFLGGAAAAAPPLRAPPPTTMASRAALPTTRFCRRVIACLDVRANDAGDLVVTKGDQYDVREAKSDGSGAGGEVRNLGKPVMLAQRYYDEGADEVTFLNITGFRDCPLTDLPMLQVLVAASEKCFVPLTVGGGIRDMTDASGKKSTALQVAEAYFRAGADKVSIGSDAVDVARKYRASGKADGSSSIEAISHVYGRQAVVVSIDPRRVWVRTAADADGHNVVNHADAVGGDRGVRGPNGESLCWYECTVQGGRKGSGLDVVQVCQAVEALGCGEILLNCIDNDGQNNGFDLGLVASVKGAVKIPVIASSGAGAPAHFSEVFDATGCEAALAASIFHHSKVGISEVKAHLASRGVATRGAPSSALPKWAKWAAVAAAAAALAVVVARRRR